MSKTRLEAFSDAVIAIILTIMVLELKVPHGTALKDLQPLWPVFVSYVASFIMLGIYWGNHHHLIHTVKEVKGGILWANMHLLFWLSLVPFATAWMGENHFAPVTLAVYAGLADLCGVAYYILLINIRRCQVGDANLESVLAKQTRKGIVSCILYTAAIPSAFVSSYIAGTLIVLVAVMWLIPDRNIERKLTRNSLQ
jgi:uncharacterized membrane protein